MALLAIAPGLARAQNATAVAVEPGDLRRENLVGREVVVDDRVARFQFHPQAGFDMIYLKRAPVVAFELPPALRPKQSPSLVAVKIRGILHHEDGRWWVDVSSYEAQPADIDRLNSEVATLSTSRGDLERRLAWARWAERRAEAFDDEALRKRAREVEADAIRAESDRPPATDQAGFWLKLAERARSRKLPEPEPSALAHRGFRAALAAATTADDLKALRSRLEKDLPDAKAPIADPVDVSRWERPYQLAPADAYRRAPEAARRVLDHRLWADVEQRYLERRAEESPDEVIALADEAARRLPDRPEVASSFLTRGLAAAETKVGSLRQGEVETLAGLYRERLHQPEKVEPLYRAWLDEQRNRRLSPRDAAGRIALADQYEALLKDRATAVSLLRDAWAIDPGSAEVAEAFRRYGFRKVNGDWVDRAAAKESRPAAEPESAAPAAAAAVEPRTPAAARSDSLRGATPDEVRTRMGGRPNRIARVASQGQLVEQWIYAGQRQDQYINLLHRPGESQPRVVSYYSLPHRAGGPSAAP